MWRAKSGAGRLESPEWLSRSVASLESPPARVECPALRRRSCCVSPSAQVRPSAEHDLIQLTFDDDSIFAIGFAQILSVCAPTVELSGNDLPRVSTACAMGCGAGAGNANNSY